MINYSLILINFRTFILILLLPAVLWGQSIDNIRFKTVDEQHFEVKEILGKGPVIMVFWASWCKPCHNELSALNQVFEKYHNQGLAILAVSIDSPRSLSKVKTFVKRSKLSYTFLLDPDGEESTKLSVQPIPYLLVANSAGEVVYSHRGYRKGDELEVDKKVRELVTAPIKTGNED